MQSVPVRMIPKSPAWKDTRVVSISVRACKVSVFGLKLCFGVTTSQFPNVTSIVLSSSRLLSASAKSWKEVAKGFAIKCIPCKSMFSTSAINIAFTSCLWRVAFKETSIFANGYLLSRSTFSKFFSREPSMDTSDTDEAP